MVQECLRYDPLYKIKNMKDDPNLPKYYYLLDLLDFSVYHAKQELIDRFRDFLLYLQG